MFERVVCALFLVPAVVSCGFNNHNLAGVLLFRFSKFCLFQNRSGCLFLNLTCLLSAIVKIFLVHLVFLACLNLLAFRRLRLNFFRRRLDFWQGIKVALRLALSLLLFVFLWYLRWLRKSRRLIFVELINGLFVLSLLPLLWWFTDFSLSYFGIHRYCFGLAHD